MGNKLCTSANKEDKADAKAEKAKARPLEKQVEDGVAEIKADASATVESTKTEVEDAIKQTELPEVNAEVKADIPEVEATTEDVVAAAAVAAVADEIKAEAPSLSDAEAVAVAEAAVADAVVTSAIEEAAVTSAAEEAAVQSAVEEAIVTSATADVQHSSPPAAAGNDDIRDDIVQAVTIETVKLSVTEYVEDAKKDAESAKDEAETKAAEIINNAVEKYDSPDDIAKGRENFMEQFRNDHKIHSVDFMRIFRNYDRDGSGYLEKKELKHFLKDLLAAKGQSVDSDKLKTYETIMMATYDSNHDGKLEMSELAALLPKDQNLLAKFPGRNNFTRADFDKMFEYYDKDDSGSIGHLELTAFIKDLFEKEGPHRMNVTDVQNYADGVFEVYDTSHDGRLSKDELALIISKFEA